MSADSGPCLHVGRLRDRALMGKPIVSVTRLSSSLLSKNASTSRQVELEESLGLIVVPPPKNPYLNGELLSAFP